MAARKSSPCCRTERIAARRHGISSCSASFQLIEPIRDHADLARHGAGRICLSDEYEALAVRRHVVAVGLSGAAVAAGVELEELPLCSRREWTVADDVHLDHANEADVLPRPVREVEQLAPISRP